MRNFLTAMLCIVGIYTSIACDVCGGAGAMSGIGFLPNSDFHFVGMTYRTRTFTTEHPKLFENEPTVSGTNVFNTTELFGRVTPSERVQLLGFLPIHTKNITDTEGVYETQGVGDVSLLANYLLVKKRMTRWYIGAGVKLPTGAFEHVSNGEFIPNLQLGAGSTDVLFTSNFTQLRNNAGVNAEVNYVLTTRNPLDYTYGNQLDMSTLFFYKKKTGKQMYVPQLGLNYAHTAKDETAPGVIEAYSGASLLSVPIGLDIYWNKWGLRMNCKLPVWGEISKGFVEPNVNAQAQLIYIIKKKEDKVTKED